MIRSQGMYDSAANGPRKPVSQPVCGSRFGSRFAKKVWVSLSPTSAGGIPAPEQCCAPATCPDKTVGLATLQHVPKPWSCAGSRKVGRSCCSHSVDRRKLEFSGSFTNGRCAIAVRIFCTALDCSAPCVPCAREAQLLPPAERFLGR